MITPKIPLLKDGQILSVDVVNSIIKRTEYAGDLLMRYKLIAGDGVTIEPQYNGTRISSTGKGNYLIFADTNWLVIRNNQTNRNAVLALFQIYFSNIKTIYCPRYVSSLKDVYGEDSPKLYFGPYYNGATEDTGIARALFTPVLHASLDPNGYIFNPIDITRNGAHQQVSGPFLFPLYGFGAAETVFNSIVIRNIQNIASKYPVIIFSERDPWKAYTNYIIQNIFNLTSDELFHDGDSTGSTCVPNPQNNIGSLLSASGTQILSFGTGSFAGSLAQKYTVMFSSPDNKPFMLNL